MEIINDKTVINQYTLGDIPEIDITFEMLKKSIGCTYLTYLYEEGNIKDYFCSNCDWQKQLIENHLINTCPIYKYAFERVNNLGKDNGNIITVWDYVPHRKGEEQDLSDFRSSYNIAHGIGVAINKGKNRESIVFGGHADDRKFYEKTLKPELISRHLKSFRNAISKSNKKEI